MPSGLNAIFERLRGILHEGKQVSKRVQYTIEALFAVRKSGFRDYPVVPEGLDLVDRAEDRRGGLALIVDLTRRAVLEIIPAAHGGHGDDEVRARVLVRRTRFFGDLAFSGEESGI